MLEFLFNKVAVLGTCNFIKEEPDTCALLWTWKLFNSNYFEKHLWMSDSKLYLKRDSNIGVSREFCELFKNTYFVEDLRMTGSETPVRGSLFNKVRSLTAWTHLTVLERNSNTGVSLWILWNLQESFFAENLLATSSHTMLLFSFLQFSKVCSLKSICLVEKC